jgi:hypothetical protein
MPRFASAHNHQFIDILSVGLIYAQVHGQFIIMLDDSDRMWMGDICNMA